MSKKQNVTWTLGIWLIVSAFWGTVCLGQDQQQNIPNQIQRLWDRMNQYAQTGLWEQARNTGTELMDLNPDTGVVNLLGQSTTYTNSYRQLTMTSADALVYRDNAVERIIKLVETRWYWDDFMHYALLGRFDLTQQFGQALLDLPPSPELLLELAGVDWEQRRARFVCVVAAARPTGILWTVEGACCGYVNEEMRGRGGFGYDPIFFYPPLGRTFAELTSAEKNAVSHRGRALSQARERLAEEFGRRC